MENFLGIILILALIGAFLGIVLGVIASFIQIGKVLAPWIVSIVLVLMYLETSDVDFNIEKRIEAIKDYIESQNNY